jgi:hypothetical protein
MVRRAQMPTRILAVPNRSSGRLLLPRTAVGHFHSHTSIFGTTFKRGESGTMAVGT